MSDFYLRYKHGSVDYRSKKSKYYIKYTPSGEVSTEVLVYEPDSVQCNVYSEVGDVIEVALALVNGEVIVRNAYLDEFVLYYDLNLERKHIKQPLIDFINKNPTTFHQDDIDYFLELVSVYKNHITLSNVTHCDTDWNNDFHYMIDEYPDGVLCTNAMSYLNDGGDVDVKAGYISYNLSNGNLTSHSSGSYPVPYNNVIIEIQQVYNEMGIDDDDLFYVLINELSDSWCDFITGWRFQHSTIDNSNEEYSVNDFYCDISESFFDLASDNLYFDSNKKIYDKLGEMTHLIKNGKYK